MHTWKSKIDAPVLTTVIHEPREDGADESGDRKSGAQITVVLQSKQTIVIRSTNLQVGRQ